MPVLPTFDDLVKDCDNDDSKEDVHSNEANVDDYVSVLMVAFKPQHCSEPALAPLPSRCCSCLPGLGLVLHKWYIRPCACCLCVKIFITYHTL